MDQHVPATESEGLRRRGVDVLTAQEAGMYSAKDEEHLAFALSGGRVIFTEDSDFLRIHAAVIPDSSTLINKCRSAMSFAG